MNLVPFEDIELFAISMLNPTGLATRSEIREHIFKIEECLLKVVDQEKDTGMVLREHFAPGVYARELFIPKGTLLTGKIHRHEHLNILLSGIVSVLTETNGSELLQAPMVMISKEGTKRALFTHEDTLWMTIHPTDKIDLSEIEKEVIAKEYTEIEIKGN